MLSSMKKSLVAAGALAALATAGAGTAQAAAPGDLCEVNTYTAGWTIYPLDGSQSYKVYAPQLVRIVAYEPDRAGASWYTARSNGNKNGSILRVAIKQSSCHP